MGKFDCVSANVVDAIKFAHDSGQRIKAPAQGSLVNAATEFDDVRQSMLHMTVRIKPSRPL